ncbi:transglutaminase family protein [Hyphomicrobium sp.]|uniref:transglutaminase family protein n=1 Tax=Hyphomicrobium sp. TaxID=82 RepID=UPI0025BC5BD9|nr:transglutaminase family protein [Hyphomicrobium sp.]MCC7251666.1 transglutaminase family protein [Hyphomicrobium sp.]
MIFDIRQTTSYTYGSFVPFAAHVLRLMPLSQPGIDIIARDMFIDPTPSEFSATRDFFGNATTHITLKTPHNGLTVESRFTVHLNRGLLAEPEATPPWEAVRAAAQAMVSLAPRSPVHQLFPSRHVPLDAAFLDYAAVHFGPGRPVLAAATDLMQQIRADFLYDPTATDVMTPARAAFAARRGVCQDFAHIMIGCLRSFGLPAAYVSGYLRTHPLPGMPRLEGADAMHAWVSVWCGDEFGWQDLDPTNGMRADTDHIALAFGRDYSDVSPIDGVIFDSGRHSLSVSVDVRERAGVQ